jgi:membrane-bound lytic murein transglycosylase D
LLVDIRRFLPIGVVLLLAGCASVPGDQNAEVSDAPAQATVTEPVEGAVGPEAEHRRSASPTVEPAAPPQDLWERIRRGYAIPGHDNARVQAQYKHFRDLDGYWARVSERAHPYLFHIVEALDARDMPTELALLPIVESAFQPFAYSHGRAAGIWQFIPATGRHYGLEQNWWYDGRRDVLAATDAALTYLEYLAEMFEGDWLLAVAAYNGGEGTVSRAIERNRQAGRPTDYWSLDLPRETMNYVPKLLAISELIAEPAAHGIELRSIPNEPIVDVVTLERQVDLALAAELAELDIETLYRLNPGYNRWATAPDGPHRLLLPLEHIPAFRRGLARTPEDRWLRWKRHRIARGETLGEIADRYHVTVDTLKTSNDIDGHIIRAGGHLLVPVASRPSGQYRLSADARRRATRSTGPENRQRRRYTVQAGDSFWAIARRHGVGVRELAGWNGMAPGDTLSIGEQLVIWTNGPARPTASDTAPGPADRLQSVTYTVRSGDSLYVIAQRFNVAVADLRRWNNIAEGSYLQPGQRLRVRVDVTAQSGGR